MGLIGQRAIVGIDIRDEFVKKNPLKPAEIKRKPARTAARRLTSRARAC